MPSTSTLHLPNGQTLSVSPVFGGFYFKNQEYANAASSPSPLPPGWTVIISTGTDKPEDSDAAPPDVENGNHTLPERTRSPLAGGHTESEEVKQRRHQSLHTFKRPTLRNDYLYISAIAHPNTHDFKPPQSQMRGLALLLWCSLLWYFHQPQPDPWLETEESKHTPDEAKPQGDWRVNIAKEGIFKGKRTLQKLERMGLIATEDSCVGMGGDDRGGDEWDAMFVSQRSFWQIDPRIYLFSLLPLADSTPTSSRPATPRRNHDGSDPVVVHGLWSMNTPDPFYSSSNLPTYYPPPAPQYIFTEGVQHPIRPKPPRQGETFYVRHVPSAGQYLSFRAASSSSKPPAFEGPTAKCVPLRENKCLSSAALLASDDHRDNGPGDPALLHKWMNNPRVSYYWGCQGPQECQDKFLRDALMNRHSFPAIGCWDEKPFGYFEIYWVKEDRVGRFLGDNVGNYDRGIHCLVGEQEFRGPHRVKLWLTSLVHFCFLSDNRTEVVFMEPRVDNKKLEQYCLEVGFFKEGQVSLPHKQAHVLKLRRDSWVAPAL